MNNSFELNPILLLSLCVVMEFSFASFGWISRPSLPHKLVTKENHVYLPFITKPDAKPRKKPLAISEFLLQLKNERLRLFDIMIVFARVASKIAAEKSRT